MTKLNKSSARILTMARTAHLINLPALLDGESSIMIPVSAFVVRLLHKAPKPMSENLILKRIREAKIHCVKPNVSNQMITMACDGIVRCHGNTGLWELTPDMIGVITELQPKAV